MVLSLPCSQFLTIVVMASLVLNLSACSAEFVPRESTWQMWLERLEVHFTEMAITLGDFKKATLLKSVGSEAYCVLHSLCSTELPTRKTYKELFSMLHTQYTPPTITFYERRQFHLARKLAEESVAAWFARTSSSSECPTSSSKDFARKTGLYPWMWHYGRRYCTRPSWRLRRVRWRKAGPGQTEWSIS
ncbi:uncharacterized protein [Drosophila takahashii]|uniref:uncharacterized protein isoform X2 n=1 Tax=Drosophila takahashii TaxID=29030 RepID=UPI0038992D69